MTPRKPSGQREPPPSKMPVPKANILEEKVAVHLAGLGRAECIQIGVSGGRDSVALLHAVAALEFKNVIVSHLNHGLRGLAADEDEVFVKALADSYGFDCESGRVDVARLAKSEKKSIETAAREARYQFFAEVAAKRACGTLLLAHHADDQVETLLMNLFRGTSRAGMGGMSVETNRAFLVRKASPLRETDREELPIEKTALPAPDLNQQTPVHLCILRPMLGVWRAEIDAYLTEKKLTYREDESNASLDFTRNRVRLELIPKINEVFGRDVRESLLRSAVILEAEEQWLASLVEGEADAPELSTPHLKAMPEAQQRRIIHQWLKNQGVPDVGFTEVERVRSLLSGTRAKINLPGGFFARRREKRLFLEKIGGV